MTARSRSNTYFATSTIYETKRVLVNSTNNTISEYTFYYLFPVSSAAAVTFIQWELNSNTVL